MALDPSKWADATPGPWEAEEEVPEMDGLPTQHGIYSGEFIVASGAFGAANAALIAAAPDLAAEVERLTRILHEAAKEASALAAKNEMLREALEFYVRQLPPYRGAIGRAALEQSR